MVKEFFKRHMMVFVIAILLLAVASNLLSGVMAGWCKNNQAFIFLTEAICKYLIAVIPLTMMFVWGYTKKVAKKDIASGFLAGLPVILVYIWNLLPLILVNPKHIKPQWFILFCLVLAKFSVGLMEEAGIRGVLLPMLCEKWKGKKNSYLKASMCSSLIFGCLHFTWVFRELFFDGRITMSHLLGRCNQVFFTFFFGVLACGVCMYAKSITPMVILHGITDMTAEILYGLVSRVNYNYYSKVYPINMQQLFYKWDLPLWGVSALELIQDIIFFVVGILLIQKAYRRDKNAILVQNKEEFICSF